MIIIRVLPRRQSCPEVFLIFGDYFFVFKMDMGIEGAGLTTAIGALITLLVMTAHFFSRKNSLRLVRPGRMAEKSRRVLVTGFSTYYFQSVMKPAASLRKSILRGLAVSGILIWLLPVIAGADSLWFAMPVTELAVAIAVTALMHKYGRERRVRGEVRH